MTIETRQGEEVRGFPAAFLRQDNNDDRGLLVALDHSDAGTDWVLAKEARSTAGTKAVATLYANAAKTAGVHFTVDVAGPSDRILRVQRSDGSLVISTITSEILSIYLLPTTTFAQIVSLWNRRSVSSFATAATFGSIPSSPVAGALSSAILSGRSSVSGNAIFDVPFAGGTDGEDIGATIDAGRKIVTLKYDDADTMQEIIDAINGGALRAKAKTTNTDLSRSPKGVSSGNRPFEYYFEKED